MAVYRCETCTGALVEYRDGLFKCSYCGNIQTIEKSRDLIQPLNDTLSSIAINNVYKTAVEAMVSQKYDEAIRLFTNIHGYLDADEKLDHCQKMIVEYNNSKIYKTACITLASAKTAENYKSAARIFKQILGYKDSAALMSKCLSTAELLHNEELYKKACDMMNEDNIHFLQQAADIFDSIATFKDSKVKQNECFALIEKQRNEILQKNTVLQQARNKAVRKKRIIFFTIIISIILVYWLLLLE